MKIQKTHIIGFLVVILALTFAGCKQPDDPVAVAGVTLNRSVLNLIVGETGTITATVFPTDADNTTISWGSDNNSVATVNNGTVTAIAPGTAIITVTTHDGGKMATCTVTVKAATVLVTGVNLDKTTLTLIVGGTETITATISPTNASNTTVSWVSSNNSVATVTGGMVNAVAPGTAKITVTTQDSGKTADCAITVTAAPTTGLAYELITTGDNANTYRVRKGTVSSGAVVIPAAYNNLPVTEIGSASDDYQNSAFHETNITSVSIPDSITSIGGNAFASCTSLTAINIPDSVIFIGNWAFYRCTSLTGITVAVNNPNFSSDNGILYNKAKTSLIQAPGGISGVVTIPNSVTSIGEGAFSVCTGFTAITIPASVMSIDDYAFSDCTGLTSVTFAAGSQLQTIGNSAFENCPNLKTVSFAAGSWLQTIGEGAFAYCYRLTSITIPASVTSIGGYAFADCTGLTSITIPDSVTSIGDGAFSCTGFTSITIPGSVTSIGESVFDGCTSLTAITVDSGNQHYSSEGGIMYNKAITVIVAVPQGKSGTVTIPESITSIGTEVFSYCKSLTSITIPDSVTSIGDSAFSYCKSLTGITIPAGVTSISGGAFYYCEGLTSITIPAGVTSIGDGAFTGCTSLKTVTFAQDSRLKTIGSWAFFGTSFTSITIPASVTSIGDYAFANTRLSSVTFRGNAITSANFGSDAFIGSSGDNNAANALKRAYLAGGAGAYRNTSYGVWTKQ